MEQNCDLQVESDEEFDALAEAGVYTVGDLLEHTKTVQGLMDLSHQSGITAEKLHFYLAKSDLMRVKGMTTADADKLYRGKITGVHALASYDPEVLIEDMRAHIGGDDFVPPTLEEASEWVASAESIANPTAAGGNFGASSSSARQPPASSVMFEPASHPDEPEVEEFFAPVPASAGERATMMFDPDADFVPAGASEPVAPKKRYVPESSREWMEAVAPLNPATAQDDGSSAAVRKREWMSRAEMDNRLQSKKNEKIRGTFTLIGIPILGVALLSLLGWVLFNMNNPALNGEEPVGMQLNLAEAERVARGFLASDSVESRKGYVANPTVVSPMMIDYYSDANPLTSHLDVRSNGVVTEEYEGKKAYAFSMLLLPELEGRRVVVRIVDGQHKVDWELSTWYQSMSLEEMADSRPTYPVQLRVTLERSFDYDKSFGTAVEVSSYRLKLPQGMTSLLGHVKKENELYRLLESSLTASSPTMRAVVEVSYPEAAKTGDMVWLDRILKEGWLTDASMTLDPQ